MPWPWPFGGSRVESDTTKRSTLPSPSPGWETFAVRGSNDNELGLAMKWGPQVLVVLATLAAFRLYTFYLQRIPGTAYIKPSFFRSRTLFGRVTSVGDGDNFHLFHTPGGRLLGWGWLRKVPTTRANLKNRTIPIRLAGIDAPEGAHFGRPAQPYSTEALQWLSSYLLNRPVRVRLYKKDQYDRIVATTYVRRHLLRRDVGLEMLKSGLATIYEAKSGAEYGGMEKRYRAAEARARTRKVGIWAIKQNQFESPRAYKSKWDQKSP